MKQKATNLPNVPSGIAVVHKDRRQHRNSNRDSDGTPFSGRRQNTRMRDKNSYDTSAVMLGNRKEEKSLHPSWEAKKKQQNIAILPAQGTRIVFT
jgi:hypothetical protein